MQRSNEVTQSLGLKLTVKNWEQIAKYYLELSKWKAKVNLCGAISEEIFWVKHLADSWLALDLINEGENVADIGSGAGFPGIPLKILKNFDLTIFEKNHKKIIFLKTLINALELSNCQVFCTKVGEAIEIPHQKYDTILLRALKIDKQLESGIAKIIKLGGRIIYFGALDEPTNALLTERGWCQQSIQEKKLPVYQQLRKLTIYQNVSRET